MQNAKTLIEYLAANREKVFKSEVKLFPPNFPPKYLGYMKGDAIAELDRAIER